MQDPGFPVQGGHQRLRRCRLGYVSDLDVRVPEGQVVAIIVYGRAAFRPVRQGGGVLHPLGVHPADRRRHHPHRQAFQRRDPRLERKRRKRC